MDFALTNEQQMLVDGAQRYIREQYGFDARNAAVRSADGFSRAQWQTFAELGWLALPLAEEHGGMGGSPADVTLLMQELGSALVVEPVVETAILCGTLLAAATANAAATPLLEAIAGGTQLVALAHTEPDGRSEYDTPVATRASGACAAWRLDGLKHRVFHGASADQLLVTARLGDGEQIGLFLVPRSASGVSVTSYALIDGTRAADIAFAGAEATLLLQGDAVAAALTLALDRAVLAMSAAAIGSMDSVMAMTSEYLKTRVQYGQPLAKFQALQHRMAEMFVETDLARSIIVRALATLETGDAAACGRAISAAKALVANACRFVTGQGIQLHGAIGTTEEYAVGHHYRAMLMYDYRFGDSAFHLDRSAGLAPLSA